MLPAKAAGIEKEWPQATHICRVRRSRQIKKKGVWREPVEEVVELIACFPSGEVSAQAILAANRGHWGIEIMHWTKDVILGEDRYTNRSDEAPRNIFTLIGFSLKILKASAASAIQAIERFQDNKNKALRLFSG